MNSWLPIGLIAVITNSTILSLAFFFLHYRYKRQYLSYWGAAFAAFAARSLCVFGNIMLGGSIKPLLIDELYFVLLAALLLCRGVSSFFGKKMATWLVATAFCLAAWIPIAVWLELRAEVLYFPLYGLLGGMFIWCGLLLLRQPDKFGNAGRRIAGWSLILWGAHQFDYFVLRHVGWFAPWGFLIGSILALIVAIGIIIMFFEKLQIRLQAKETQFHSILQSAMDGFWIVSRDGKLLEVNDAYCRMIGYSRDELLNMEIFDLESSMTPEVAAAKMEHIIAKGADRFETRHRHKDGGVVDVEISVQFQTEDGGKFINFVRDITERKRADTALRKSELRLRTLKNSIPDPIWLKDQDGNYLYCNNAFERFIGAKETDITGRDDYHFFDRQLADFFRENDRTAIEAGKPVVNEEWLTFAEDGYHGLFETIKTPMRDAQGNLVGVLGIARDVTQRKRIEEKIREREIFLREVQRIAMVGGWKANIEDDFLFWSDEVNHILDLPVDYKPNLSDGLRFFVPTYLQRIRDMLTAALHGGPTADIECEVMTRTGKRKWANLRAAGQVETDGHVSVFGTIQDIDAQKRTELELLNATMKAESASKAKSEFLANMSHEIRTPLNGVMGMLQLIETTALNEEQREYLQAALQSSARLTRLLSDILDLSRVEAGKILVAEAEFELRELIESVTASFAQEALRKGLRMELQMDDELPRSLVGDETRVRQILFNLIGNAVKFTEAGLVRVEVSPLNAPDSRRCRLLIVVNDSGIGIPEERIKDIFEPFTQVEGDYTRRFQGAGLGLSIVRKLVKLIGGSMHIDSAEGEGTTIFLSLTCRLPDPEAALRPGARPAGELPTGSCSTLVADDDELSLFAIRKTLEKMGHTVTSATNGLEVLERLAGNRVDLVLLDVQMPVMDGVEVTRKIRSGEMGAEHKDIPIIAMTAYAMVGDKEKFLGAGMNDYIAKPLITEDLQIVIDRALHLPKNPARHA